MNNLVLTCIYNEETLIKLFLTYYNSLLSKLGQGKIIFIDFGCIDSTINIINNFKLSKNIEVEIIKNFTFEHREDVMMLFRNHYWKRFKDDFNYVFIVDVDEIVYDDNLIENLSKGVDCFLSEGVDIITNSFKNISKQIKQYTDINLFLDSVKFFPNLNKINIFNPKTFHPNYNDGCHISKPIGKIPNIVQSTYLLHFKHIGYKLFLKNAISKEKRYNFHSKKYGHGFHYSLDKLLTNEQYNEKISNTCNIKGRIPILIDTFAPNYYKMVHNFNNMFS